MRKLIVSEFVTLDGVMQGPGSPEEDPRDGFPHGGWQMPYVDETFLEAADEAIERCGGYVFGRRTYEIMAAYWPNQPDSDRFARALNPLPKYVASTTLREPLAWQNSTLLQGDVPKAVAELKEQRGKDLVVLGSGELVRTLMENDLIDEYQLMLNPIVLGSGHRLFRHGTPATRMRLVEAKPTTTGVVMLTYTLDR